MFSLCLSFLNCHMETRIASVDPEAQWIEVLICRPDGLSSVFRCSVSSGKTCLRCQNRRGCRKMISSPGPFWASVARLFLKGRRGEGVLIVPGDGACLGDIHSCFSPHFTLEGHSCWEGQTSHTADCWDLNFNEIPQTFILYCVQSRHKSDRLPLL